MHIVYALVVMDDSYPKGLHDIIVRVLYMVLEYVTMLPPHDLSQIKPQLLPKVNGAIFSCNRIAIRTNTICFGTNS